MRKKQSGRHCMPTCLQEGSQDEIRFHMHCFFSSLLKLWDLATGKLLHEFLGHKTYVEAIAITPDARLALSSSDNALKLWDLSEWTQLPKARP